MILNLPKNAVSYLRKRSEIIKNVIGTVLRSRRRSEDQCDQIGPFSKVLGNKSYLKVAQILGDFWGYLKIGLLYVKLLWLHFAQLLENFGLLYIATSGHTG